MHNGENFKLGSISLTENRISKLMACYVYIKCVVYILLKLDMLLIGMLFEEHLMAYYNVIHVNCVLFTFYFYCMCSRLPWCLGNTLWLVTIWFMLSVLSAFYLYWVCCWLTCCLRKIFFILACCLRNIFLILQCKYRGAPKLFSGCSVPALQS